MAAPVSTATGFLVGAVVELFQDASLGQGSVGYDVSADGKRFLLRDQVQDGETKAPAIRIVENWFEEFRDRQRD